MDIEYDVSSNDEGFSLNPFIHRIGTSSGGNLESVFGGVELER